MVTRSGMNESAVITYNDMQRLSVRALMLTKEDIQQIRNRITYIQDEDDQMFQNAMLDAIINYLAAVQEEWQQEVTG